MASTTGTVQAQQIRTAETTWRGSLADGEGSVSGVSSRAFEGMAVSWPSRTEAPDGRTSPEELLAAAHASCFSMALASRLTKAGSPPERLVVRADVTFAQGDAGWRVASSALTVQAVVDGLDDAQLTQLAEDAKENCPISQALRGNVEMTVSVSR